MKMLEMKVFHTCENGEKSAAKTKWIILWPSVWKCSRRPTTLMHFRDEEKAIEWTSWNRSERSTFVQHKFAGKSFSVATHETTVWLRCVYVCVAKTIGIFAGARRLFLHQRVSLPERMFAWECTRMCACRWLCLVSLFRVNHICICKNFNLVLVNVCTILWIYPKKVPIIQWCCQPMASARVQCFCHFSLLATNICLSLSLSVCCASVWGKISSA